MDDFDWLAGLLRDRSGLVLTRDKVYLVESRLVPVAKRFGMKTVAELAAALRLRAAPDMTKAVVEAMTTNESFFFRDGWPFDQFRTKLLPELLQSRAARKRIRIWSAAASTGQEPYSLAMILADEKPRLAGWTVEIIATDLSTEVLAKAQAGVYSHFEVQRGLPIKCLTKYFAKDGDQYQLSPEIRGMVRFQPRNLLDDLASLGAFDVIFCRNVLIYFDQPTKKRVLEGMAKLLPSDGYLFLGGAETVLGITDALAPLPGSRGIYGPAPATPMAKIA